LYSQRVQRGRHKAENNYFRRQIIKETRLKNIAIFASGEGSNALNIVRHFKESGTARVVLLVSNKVNAPVLAKAVMEDVSLMILGKKEYFEDPAFANFLQKQNIDLIVLAGFLWLVPPALINAFPNKIVNIHPALLPAHGGKGMYGSKVHQAIIASGAKESGITIHYVNEHFDEGKIIFQAKCSVSEDETPGSLALKIHGLEHENYPNVIGSLLV